MAIGLISLASMGDVSATPDVIYVNDSSGNDSWDGESDVWDGLTTGPKKTIKNATGTVINGGTINIADGFYSGENNRNITIDKNMTIIGHSMVGTIINGSNSAQIFLIMANVTVMLQNLTITNGNGSSGGAIYNNGILSLSETSFTFNTAELGGAIFNYGNMAINNSIFNENFATSSSGSVGGAILNLGDLEIIFSIFNNNIAISSNEIAYGGAIGNYGNLSVNESEFVHNEANLLGGAVDNGGKFISNKVSFSENFAVGGGAVSNQGNSTLYDCEFLLNAAEYGGAVYNIGNLTINANNFTNNSVNSFDNDTTCAGGAIFTGVGTLIINSSKFTDNAAQSDYTETPYYGGAISNYDSVTNIINSEFIGNFADTGGAISNEGSLTVKNSSFTENTASCPSEGIIFDGGAISNYGTCNIYDSNFTDNYADMGGAISNWLDSNVTVLNSNFQRNSATVNGDAVYNEGTLVAHFCQIMDNGIDGYYPEDICNYGSADARYNWWGSNQDPSNRVVDCNVSSWLVLRLNPSVSAINNGGTSVLTADLLYDVKGVYHNPTNGHVPDGIVVKFTSTLGTIGTTYVSMVNGVAKSTLNGGSTAGVADVVACTANQSIHKSVKIEFIPPKVIYSYPKKYATGVSRTKVLYIKFSESILAGINWSKIVVKNKYGKVVSITKWISGNVLYIKTNTKRSSYSYYTIYIPASAVKDLAGNGFALGYTIKFKTGGY